MPARCVVPTVVAVDMLTLLLAGYTSDLRFDLFQNPLGPNESTSIGDFTVADYTGYAQQTLARMGPFADDGYADVPHLKGRSGPYVVTFPGNLGADQTVYGVYCHADSSEFGDQILFASNCFDPQNAPSLTGKTISGPGDTTSILVNLRLWDYTQDQGEVTVLKMTSLDGDSVSVGSHNFRIEALCRDRSLNTFYPGTVQLTCSDTAATFDAPGGLSAGQGTFNFFLATAGTTIVTVTEVGTDHITDALSLTVNT